MNTDEAKTLSETALTRLIEALERGQSQALKLYLAVMSRFHRYSWGNVLLIYSQRPHATRVAGFQAWLRMRRYVRKGEKGIVILAPMSDERGPPMTSSLKTSRRGSMVFEPHMSSMSAKRRRSAGCDRAPERVHPREIHLTRLR
jgi:hypothetical protein